MPAWADFSLFFGFIKKEVHNEPLLLQKNGKRLFCRFPRVLLRILFAALEQGRDLFVDQEYDQ